MALTLTLVTIALFVGTFVGILIASLCYAAKWGDEYSDQNQPRR